jgi:hypothetical protein
MFMWGNDNRCSALLLLLLLLLLNIMEQIYPSRKSVCGDGPSAACIARNESRDRF